MYSRRDDRLGMYLPKYKKTDVRTSLLCHSKCLRLLSNFIIFNRLKKQCRYEIIISILTYSANIFSKKTNMYYILYFLKMGLGGHYIHII